METFDFTYIYMYVVWSSYTISQKQSKSTLTDPYSPPLPKSNPLSLQLSHIAFTSWAGNGSLVSCTHIHIHTCYYRS